MPESQTRSPFSQILSKWIMRLIGWRILGEQPAFRRYVLIGAPHTSNWDFIIAMLMKYSLQMRFHFIGKDSLFRGPMGTIMRRLGGIPVRRESRSNFVAQIVAEFEQREDLIIVISPEGTRSKSPYWKTGFYYIALGAKVPVVMAYLDYKIKVIGFGPSFVPTGDIQADFAHIRELYADKSGKYPDKQGAIELRPSSA
ncbi:MAG: lysophospholipid acyltransferase family protein [Anaerolineales bacterium]|nr:MAG: lysophospholipid acyltransferase family protein [Anaerolineales bacterium]